MAAAAPGAVPACSDVPWPALFRDTVDWDLIETHWKDLMQVVLSIKTGKIAASTLMRKLGNYSRKNRLYQTFKALGSAVRTLFLLQYISNRELREQITASTNKVVRLVARVVEHFCKRSPFVQGELWHVPQDQFEVRQGIITCGAEISLNY
ncbi:Tn3 family transposase [Xanthomonas hortorum pv. carotae]|nr:Tn3 family transposase [Xanthomonas hortorum pv. carotae]